VISFDLVIGPKTHTFLFPAVTLRLSLPTAIFSHSHNVDITPLQDYCWPAAVLSLPPEVFPRHE
jgi:hypothetical protein